MKDVKGFIKENENSLKAVFEDGGLVVVLGPEMHSRTTMVEALKSMLTESIGDESLYDNCVNIETAHAARIVADVSSKVAGFIGNYESDKQTQRFLISDLRDAQHFCRGAKSLALVCSMDCKDPHCNPSSIKARLKEILDEEQFNLYKTKEPTVLYHSSSQCVYFVK